MSATEIISELPKLTRVELEAVDARLHELLRPPAATSPANWAQSLSGLAGSIDSLPADYALNHDHYLHGAQKR